MKLNKTNLPKMKSLLKKIGELNIKMDKVQGAIALKRKYSNFQRRR